VTTLELNCVRFQVNRTPAEAARNLSASFAENTSLEVFECMLARDLFYRNAIFRGLAEHTKIKTLALRCLHHVLPEELEALRLAVAAKTLVHVKFYSGSFASNWFVVILQEIRDSPSVCQISLLDKCSLDEGSTRLLHELFTTTTAHKRYSFCFASSLQPFGHSYYYFFRDVLRSNTCMSELALHRYCSDMHDMHDHSVEAIASAVEKYAGPVLESLVIPTFDDRAFDSLVWRLPKMKHLRKLNLSVRGVEIPGSVQMLLKKLKRNSSLWQVTVDLGEDIPEADTHEMEFYAQRNQHMHAIVAAPKATVRLQSAWPRVIRAVQGCEMEGSIIFAALTALGRTWDRESSVSMSLKRKRESRDDGFLVGQTEGGCAPPVV
jgi:hypothetical protein